MMIKPKAGIRECHMQHGLVRDMYHRSEHVDAMTRRQRYHAGWHGAVARVNWRNLYAAHVFATRVGW